MPVTDLYIFIKTYFEIGSMMHVLCTGCSQSPSASPWDLWTGQGIFRIVLERMWGSSCLGAGGELSTKVTGTFLHWWGRSWLWFCVSPVCSECLKQVCTFDMILHFQSHQSILWILMCVWLNCSNSSNTFSPFCLQGNIPVSVLGYFWKTQ